MGSAILILMVNLFLKDVSGLSNCRQLKCSTSCETDVKDNIKLEGKILSCQIRYHVKGQVYPNEDDIASRAPEDLTLDWYVYKENVALNVTWQMKAHSILSGTTKGFHVDIDDISYLLKFKMNDLIQERNNPKILDQTEKDVNCIKFQYSCHGRKFQKIPLPYAIDVYIRSLPSSQLHDRQKFVYEMIYIPDCKHDQKLRYYNDDCSLYWKNMLEARDPSRLQTDTTTSEPVPIETKRKEGSNNYITLAISSVTVLLLLLLLVTLILLVWIKKKKTLQVSEDRDVLLITDDTDSEESVRAQHFFYELLKLPNLKLSCNWQCQIEISKDRPLWYNQNFHKAQIIMFITNSLSLIEHIGIPDDNLAVIFKNVTNYAFRHNQHKQVILVTNTAERKEKLMREWVDYKVYNQENEADFEDLRRILTGKKAVEEEKHQNRRTETIADTRDGNTATQTQILQPHYDEEIHRNKITGITSQREYEKFGAKPKREESLKKCHVQMLQ